MRTVYAVLNPDTGKYTLIDSESEALDIFVGRVFSLALPFFSNVPYMIVTETAEGEVWAQPDGNVISRISEEIISGSKGISKRE